mmetsp:Transcript_791/g.1356  ORF Transcript_791/g.1356 Transcript_791/m.1356 type:complete len:102 (-) Transcript_791:7-312(-)
MVGIALSSGECGEMDGIGGRRIENYGWKSSGAMFREMKTGQFTLSAYLHLHRSRDKHSCPKSEGGTKPDRGSWLEGNTTGHVIPALLDANSVRSFKLVNVI